MSSLNDYFKEIKEYGRLTAEDTNRLFAEYIENGRTDFKIRDKIFHANMRLVVSLAKNFSSNETDMWDFIQQGNLALLYSIEKYDYKKGTKFSSYASSAICHSIVRYMNENGKTIRIPGYKRIEMGKVAEAIEALEKEMSNEKITPEIVAEFLEWDYLKVSELMTLMQLNQFVSLDKKAYKDGDDSITLQDVVADSRSNDIEELEDRLSDEGSIHEVYYGVDTLRVKETFVDYFKETDSIIKDASPIDLYKGIEEISPTFTFNRLICTLYPESDFAKIVDGDYGRQFSDNEYEKRNAIILDAIDEFIPKEYQKPEFPWFPYYSCDITKAFTRKDRGFGSNRREKCFLIALVFNLEFQQLEEFMMHSIGERCVDFKNPYEVILAYCLCSHTNICEEYLRLKNLYEKERESVKQINISKSTIEYENVFWNIETEKDLITFLLTLPEKNSESANRVFVRNYAIVKQVIEKKISSFDASDIDFESFHEMALEKCKKSNIDKSFFEKMRVNTELIDDIIGADKEGKNGKIVKSLKKKVFTTKQFRDFLNFKDTPNKEQLLLLIFYRYCISNARENVIIRLKENDNFVEKLYNHFEQYTYEDLEEAGFDSLHILDNFERFLFFCTLTEEPLKTFQMILTREDL